MQAVMHACGEGASADETANEATPPGRGFGAADALSNILFIIAVVALLAVAATVGASGRPVNVLGYSAQTVLTESMADVYPKDTLLVTRQTDPYELRVGDDITFMVSADTTFTHRIVEVLPGHGPASPSFRTQGTKNPAPDPEPVLSENVVGKVVLASPEAGAAAVWAKSNWPLLAMLLGIALLAKLLIRVINRDAGEHSDEFVGGGLEKESCLVVGTGTRSCPPNREEEAASFVGTGTRSCPPPGTPERAGTSSRPYGSQYAWQSGTGPPGRAPALRKGGGQAGARRARA